MAAKWPLACIAVSPFDALWAVFIYIGTRLHINQDTSIYITTKYKLIVTMAAYEWNMVVSGIWTYTRLSGV